MLRLKTVISLTEKQMAVVGDPQQDLLSVAILCIFGIFPLSVKVADKFIHTTVFSALKEYTDKIECTVLVRDIFTSSLFM